MEMNLLVALAILLLMFVIGLAVLTRQRKSHRLARRFGSDYERTVQRMGRGPAEAELAAREKREDQLEILALAPHEAQRYRLEWQSVQARFGHSPRTAIAEADLLARDAMTRCGYPMADFDARAGELSMRHPQLVANYRAGHELALRDRREQADTDSLRLALMHYRALFTELLQAAPARPRAAEPRRAAPALRPERAMARDQARSRDRPS
jgi:hypothetical protein